MFQVSPGVLVKEKDLSNIIPSVATTTCGLVGYSTKGSLDTRLISNASQFLAEYGNPVPGYYFHYTALAFLEQGNVLYCRRVINGALYGGAIIVESGTGDNEALTVGVSTPAFSTVSTMDALFYVFAKDPGTWNNSIGITITDIDSDDYTFNINVYYVNADGGYDLVETWTVSRKEQLDGFGRQLYMEDKINGYSDYIIVKDNATTADTVLPEEQATRLNLAGGTIGNAVTDGNLITAWDAFSNPDVVDIRILLNGGYTSVAVQQKMKSIAEDRKDCIAILDVPYDEIEEVTDTIDWRKNTQNFNSSYTALYSPWVKIYDQFNDKLIEVPPSGHVGAQFAYNDFVGEPWTAPAGLNRGQLNVIGLSKIYSKGERNVLYPAQINCLQVFPGQGNVIWGQKTQQVKASALDRINVRRLLIVIEKAASAALDYYCFENNNDLTRFRITSQLEEYLDLLAAKGAFQTEAGDKGYRVVCDTTNNTPAVIDRNELKVSIFVKPAKTAEFIELQIITTTTGASFDELISKGVLF